MHDDSGWVGQMVPSLTAESGPPTADPAIAKLAGRQHGVVSRAQLRDIGLSDSSIGQRVACGRLHRLHAGVFAVGHEVLALRGRWMAAVLACGPGAVLSHASAAELWGLRFGASRWIDVTIPRTGRRNRDPIRIHRPRSLPAAEVTTHHAIPVTSAARTILDMAAILRRAHLEAMLDRMEIRELTDYPALARTAAAHPGHHGTGRLRTALATHVAGEQVTRSDLEVLFRQICRDHGLPLPRVNQRIAGREVDFLFAGPRLIVETDSWRYHRTRRAFEDDRARDALLLARGYRTLRVTDRQLTRAPAAVAALLAEALRPAA
jgi:very-short-patch-repair endonuclease